MAFHQSQRQLSEDASALADALTGIEIAQLARGGPPQNKEVVVHAIEAAASVLRDQATALRDQISENERLRSALRVREWEVQNFQRIDQRPAWSHPEKQSQDEFQKLQQVTPNNQLLSSRELWAGNGFSGDPQSSLIVHPNVQSLADNPYRFASNGWQSWQYSSNFGANGAPRNRNLPDGPFSRTSSPTARSMSPVRHGREGEAGVRIQPPGAVGNAQPWQELVKSAPRPQDEIKHLKKLVSDLSLKEMQLVHENYMLEKRLSELRLTIEKYQQELMDATSRETSVRQDVLEENAWLTSEIRAAAQEINIYASSLMPLLAEFNVQPAKMDPHSIVTGIKTLIQHLREEARKDTLQVREEPTSSLSDAEEDPLPDIEGLCINGNAVLGNKITASGVSINGTTLCHFQWVRHHRDGSFFHIPGAAQPEYTITADDVDTRLSLECTPMDDRKRKGEMVQVFVNDHNWISVDPEMNDQIMEYLENEQVNFDVKLVVDNSQDVSLEPALLSLKRSTYELKKMNGKRMVGSERYASESAVDIKVGKDAQCAILNNAGVMHLLACTDNRSRDLLVLTMREFINAALGRKKGKKRLWLK